MIATGGPLARVAFSSERRRSLLRQYFSLEGARIEIDRLRASADPVAAYRLHQHDQSFFEERSRLRREYEAGVPVVALSRCPITGQVAYHSIDYFDLDGLWWNYEGPIRPREQLLPTYFAVTGAVRLLGLPARAPFLSKPGPEVPYVIPRLLQHGSVVAVLSSLGIGPHQGFAILYFAHPVPDVTRVNTWGTNEYQVVDAEGDIGWDEAPLVESDMDFELAPWISAGRLWWIAPGDPSLTLRGEVAGCPYLGLSGRRAVTRIQAGRVWWQELPGPGGVR